MLPKLLHMAHLAETQQSSKFTTTAYVLDKGSPYSSSVALSNRPDTVISCCALSDFYGVHSTLPTLFIVDTQNIL